MYLNRYAYDMTRASHARERVRRWARKGTHEFVLSPRRGGARLATEETNAFDGAFRRVRAAARDHTRCYIIQNICDIIQNICDIIQNICDIQNICERGAVASVTALCHSPQGPCRVAVRAWRSRPGPCLFGGERQRPRRATRLTLVRHLRNVQPVSNYAFVRFRAPRRETTHLLARLTPTFA